MSWSLSEGGKGHKEDINKAQINIQTFTFSYTNVYGDFLHKQKKKKKKQETKEVSSNGCIWSILHIFTRK